MAQKFFSSLAVAGLVSLFAGCGLAPATDLKALEAQNRALAETSKAQLAEIENLKVHSRSIENQLIRAEEDLAKLDQKTGIERKQLANFKRERSAIGEQFVGLGSGARMPTRLSEQLVELSRRYPSLQYDPQTGVSKLDTDVLFDSGANELKPDAERMLTDFAQLFQSVEARDMKVMVVGHTDSLKVAKKEARSKFADNWQLSTGRALTVADHLRKAGIRDDRMGIAGFGGHQPIAANSSPEDRRLNRRVEIFVVAPDTPVVGWTESMVTAYGAGDTKPRR